MEKEELYNDDCIEVMKNLPENYIDMVFCDLPYGTTQNSWDSMIAFDKLWENYDRIVKENGAIVLTSQQPFTSQLIMSNIKNFRYEWIWEKNKATGHLNAKRMPMKSHENICIFYKKLPMYNPQKTMDHKAYGAVKPNISPSTEQKRNYNHHFQPGNDGNTTDRYPRTVQKFSVMNNDDPEKWHPTQKPVELIEYFIKTYSKKNDRVLDNCMGSGSTGIACANLNRKFVGIEIDKEYYDMTKSRLNKSVGLTEYMGVCE